jgi:hypothetical protein
MARSRPVYNSVDLKGIQQKLGGAGESQDPAPSSAVAMNLHAIAHSGRSQSRTGTRIGQSSGPEGDREGADVADTDS